MSLCKLIYASLCMCLDSVKVSSEHVPTPYPQAVISDAATNNQFKAVRYAAPATWRDSMMAAHRHILVPCRRTYPSTLRTASSHNIPPRLLITSRRLYLIMHSTLLLPAAESTRSYYDHSSPANYLANFLDAARRPPLDVACRS